MTSLVHAYLLSHIWHWYLTPQLSLEYKEYKEIRKWAGMNSILWMKLCLRYLNLVLWSLVLKLGTFAWRSRGSGVQKELEFHILSLSNSLQELWITTGSVILASDFYEAKRLFILTLRHGHRSSFFPCLSRLPVTGQPPARVLGVSVCPALNCQRINPVKF